MSYTVLARRYRSRDFDEVVGQDTIARTLCNAIEQDRIAHAYLFCGTRGVGKTSMARIFAKALNVSDDQSQRDEIADAIMRGEDLDVIEIDGASNRGIQEARDLIAGAGLSPARSPYKIYIIDEVHMLTQAAFNALLKTMEEPPAHVKFILATTDPHKVPATIQSRCQRFDFKTLSAQQIARQLAHILGVENVKASEDVQLQIARLGDGSMRDALSVLDRLLATGINPITAEVVEETLGLPSQALLGAVVDAAINADPAAVLNAGAALLASGATYEQVLSDLAIYFRNLMVLATCGVDSDLIEMSSEGRRLAEKQVSHFDAADLVHAIALCDNVARNARGSTSGRALYDAALVRLSLQERYANAAALLAGGGIEKKKQLNTSVEVTPRPQAKAISSAGDGKATSGSRKPSTVPASIDESPHTSAKKTKVPAPVLTEVKQTTPPKPVDVHMDAARWIQLTEHESVKPAMRAKMEQLSLAGVDGQILSLNVKESGAGTLRFLQKQQETIEQELQRLTGARWQVRIAEASKSKAPGRKVSTEVREQIAREPLVREAMQLFDADIESVEDGA